ncbi:MAG: hypothetical protein GVY19_13975 [Bacteroidetes bacterium]|jgi:hypothetical protein|nr:hypothetical protein [Bacteroidota bacterium]
MFRLFVALLIASSLSLYAGEDEKADKSNTIDIKGNIVDVHNGQALTGVCVKIAGTGRETYTDFEGNFEFDNMSAGDYKIISEYISYKTNISSLQTRDDQYMVIRLESL